MTEKHFCLDDSPQFKMLELDEVTSTNDFLRGFRPPEERKVTLATAEFQTAGRGAGTNHWDSRRGQNLLFSLLIHPRHIPAEQLFVLSEALSLAIYEAIKDFMPSAPCLYIKWPNDIYCGDHKICGMLIENDLRGTTVENCVMGVGLNVNQTEFSQDIPNPISLAQILGRSIERRFVLERVMEYFLRYYEWTEQGRSAELHAMYLSRLYRKDEKHYFHDEMGDFEGTIIDVEPSGHLIIRDEVGRQRRYAFKEVEYVIEMKNEDS